MCKMVFNISKELKIKLKIIAAKKDCTVSKLLIDTIEKMIKENS